MSYLLSISGKAAAPVAEIIRRHQKDQPVGEVALIVRASLAATSDVNTAHRGKDHVARFRMDTVILATDEEGEELLDRLNEVRAEDDRANAEKAGQGNLADSKDDEYAGLTHHEARSLCKERKLSAKGSRLELIQRLRDNA